MAELLLDLQKSKTEKNIQYNRESFIKNEKQSIIENYENELACNLKIKSALYTLHSDTNIRYIVFKRNIIQIYSSQNSQT